MPQAQASVPVFEWLLQQSIVLAGMASGSTAATNSPKPVDAVPRISAAHNNGLHQTKGAEERPRHLVGGRSLRAPFAGEAGCCAGVAGWTSTSQE